MVAFEGAMDLTLVCAIFLVIGCLVVVKGGAQAIADVLNIGIAGVHPFAGVARSLENSVIGFLDRQIQSLQKHAISLLSGLVDSMAVLIAIPLLLGLGVKYALTKMWHLVTNVDVGGKITTIRVDAAQALTKANNALTRIDHLARGLPARLESTMGMATQAANLYTLREIDSLRRGIGDDIGRIRSSVDQAVEQAKTAAATEAGKVAGQIAQAENAAITTVQGLENLTRRELHDLLGRVNTGDIAALVSAVPILAALVTTLEAETGLNNAECRGKVKQICGTDAGAWQWLLGGALALDFALNLEEIVTAGREVIHYVAAGAEDLASLV
jgi:hypothetical protein